MSEYTSSGKNINIYLSYPGEYKKPKRSLVYWATKSNSYQVLQLLLSSQQLDRTMPVTLLHPVYSAIAHDRGWLVDLYMENGLSPLTAREVDGKMSAATLISDSLFWQKWNVVRAMIAYIPDPIDWNSLLKNAQWSDVSIERTKCIKYMLSRGMPYDIVIDEDKTTLVRLANDQNDFELLKLLRTAQDFQQSVPSSSTRNPKNP
jgi:hypothetical protein